ncbi:MAG: hypothetical protein ACI350_03735 [Prevotella sp.]
MKESKASERKITRAKTNATNKRAEIALAALEKNSDVNLEEFFKKMNPPRRSIKERLLDKLLCGCIFTLFGAENRFLLNARVNYSFIKNKATVIFYINDIFNQDTRYHSTVTTTTRTEGSSGFLHQYASLAFNYKFEAKK